MTWDDADFRVIWLRDRRFWGRYRKRSFILEGRPFECMSLDSGGEYVLKRSEKPLLLCCPGLRWLRSA
jgi:hypothetical protein